VSEFAMDVRALVDLVADVDHGTDSEGWDDLEQGLLCWGLISDAARDLARIRDELGKRLADAMPDKRAVVEGAGVFEKHRKKDRTQWDKEDLLRAVLDTRQFDEDGTDTSPLEKVLKVWNLPAPRVTALRELGIDADEFCHVESGGWALQLTPVTASTEKAA
jgi:hypothetical protein